LGLVTLSEAPLYTYVGKLLWAVVAVIYKFPEDAYIQPLAALALLLLIQNKIPRKAINLNLFMKRINYIFI
jgi:hypothetical protein